MGGHAGIVRLSRELLHEKLGISKDFRITKIFTSSADEDCDVFILRVAGPSLPLIAEADPLTKLELSDIQEPPAKRLEIEPLDIKSFLPGIIVHVGPEYQYFG